MDACGTLSKIHVPGYKNSCTALYNCICWSKLALKQAFIIYAKILQSNLFSHVCWPRISSRLDQELKADETRGISTQEWPTTSHLKPELTHRYGQKRQTNMTTGSIQPHQEEIHCQQLHRRDQELHTDVTRSSTQTWPETPHRRDQELHTDVTRSSTQTWPETPHRRDQEFCIDVAMPELHIDMTRISTSTWPGAPNRSAQELYDVATVCDNHIGDETIPVCMENCHSHAGRLSYMCACAGVAVS